MNIHLTTEQNIARLTFDRENASANIFDKDILLELDALLDGISKISALSALVIQSAKPNIFIAGADLKTLSSADDKSLLELIHLGQKVFNKLESLHLTTIAAIHGACLGGGLELALACDYRIASDASCTRIGLPETQLGILPAWGGSTRLPMLIGLPNALPLILSGKILKADAAQHKGIVDAVCPPEKLREYAASFHTRPKREHQLYLLEHNPLSVALIRKKASDSLFKKTQGLYPALNLALKVVCDGVRTGLEQSLSNEREAISELSQTPESKCLLNLFFQTEHAKKLKIAGSEARPLNNIAVLGAGVMGSGIAYWLSTKKRKVLLKDIDEQALTKGISSIEKLYESATQKRILSKIDAQAGLDRIQATSHNNSLCGKDLIIEAATEDLELKKKIFTQLSEKSDPSTILATNTSALPIHQLADSISHPERLIGIHFFNPVPRMKLVEVVRTKTTSDETLASAVNFVQVIGKLPVVVTDSPGFVVNRILLPYLVRAGELFSEGHPPETIDKAMLDFGMPMGPLRLLDEIGIDVAQHVAKTLSEAFPDRMKVPPILNKLMSRNLLGRKSNAGFYLYNNGKTHENPSIQPSTTPDSSRCEIQNDLVTLMSKEAAMCLDEGVAASAAEIDFAMVMGTGYAPFRGGPLRYAHDTQLLSRSFYED
ncbi:3-hydroxyacyl-CoA dehydrogenase NAD-binding domain-containing protein [Rubritalea spongiae]|uniref:enoyl-CoA hydratase n=1 Tax=Rubritalea spongiae TaxID=430797 RepID=A0ABW5E3W1_9BACT